MVADAAANGERFVRVQRLAAAMTIREFGQLGEFVLFHFGLLVRASRLI